MKTQLNCGDLVFDVADPRHVGRIDAILARSRLAKIVWQETGWLSFVPVENLQRTNDNGNATRWTRLTTKFLLLALTAILLTAGNDANAHPHGTNKCHQHGVYSTHCH